MQSVTVTVHGNDLDLSIIIRDAIADYIRIRSDRGYVDSRYPDMSERFKQSKRDYTASAISMLETSTVRGAE